jgi:thermitase
MKRNALAIGAVAAMFSLAVSAFLTLPEAFAQGRPEFVDNELLVKFKPGTPAQSQNAAHAQQNARVVREIEGLDVKVVQVGRGQAEQRLPGYQLNPNVEYAELNGIAYALFTNPPTDPLYSQQWNLNNTGQTGGKVDADIDAPQAWSVNSGSAKIAILDTGVRESHPDMVGKVVDRANWTWMDSVNGVPARDVTDDRHGHGTHVAGIAAALTNNVNPTTSKAEGIAGACPECALIAGKVLNDDGSGAYDYIANGILWAVGCDDRDSATNECRNAVRARSINMSLGGTYNSITLQDAVNKAWGRGAVLSCAAGNNGNSVKFYPAAYTNCIAVAATDYKDARAGFSNYGKNWVDVAAPGVSITSSTITSAGYEAWNGTSMASPHVAGLAGLLLSKSPSSTASSVRSQIESTADRIPGTGSHWSKGRINACKALAGANCATS